MIPREEEVRAVAQQSFHRASRLEKRTREVSTKVQVHYQVHVAEVVWAAKRSKVPSCERQPPAIDRISRKVSVRDLVRNLAPWPVPDPDCCRGPKRGIHTATGTVESRPERRLVSNKGTTMVLFVGVCNRACAVTGLDATYREGCAVLAAASDPKLAPRTVFTRGQGSLIGLVGTKDALVLGVHGNLNAAV